MRIRTSGGVGGAGVSPAPTRFHPELERFVANRMCATTYEVESSHVPMLSNPGVVIDAIRTLANSLQGALVG